ncbi:F-BAR and double SH3 domains protein 2 isoform X2 [Agrilus planipennis]|uniref:F-BAR and double SH3 domains protein 2 isoform X2 n=1 Tax=Agrilus planipennis TaxID=224129 RepID=A0A1W4X4Q9_AGRPL|nr:F-BAR and double SH3 domains protein 2 isoform X2 [Agrilus planipennis]
MFPVYRRHFSNNNGNYAKFLKTLHSEQITKLLAKNQHECDLLEDIRTFVIKKSAIERSYSEALLKISSAYLNKKIPNIPDIKVEGSEEKWNMWSVWRTVLEEHEKLARARLAAIEIFQQQIADEAKNLRMHKIQTARKYAEQIATVQKELQACVQDLDKTKKLYFDEEHTAHDVRDKARDIEEKLKKKKGSFFQSITSLQKNSAKVTSKREQLEEKSSGARNDYILCLAAANAHQNRYFVVDLQLTMQSMESNVFDKVAEYLSLLGRTELLTCSAMQNSFSTVLNQSKQLTREYNLQCVYLFYPVLKQHIQYEFEPCEGDPVDHITAEHESAAAQLSKEARRWATKIARESNNIKDSVRKLQIYNSLRESGQKTDPNDPNSPDLETKIEEMKQNIRRAETAKVKAEARIEVLRKGGVNVDEWLKEAETLTVQDIQRSASSLSDHPSSDSFYDSDFADGEVQQTISEKPDKSLSLDDTQQESYEAPEVDAMLEQERQRIEQLTVGWDDPTQVDWGAEESREPVEGTAGDTTSVSGPTFKCTALYSYTAQNSDELSIVENEQLEVVGEGDGDGWLRARNYRGEEGYVPQNYLDIEREPSGTSPGLVNQISFSSVDYTVDNDDELAQQSETTNQSPEQISVIHMTEAVPEPTVSYCAALYDYEGEGEEDLTLEEGQIIKVISKCAHGVDDGWWKGELDGKVGNFPSLVVEECDENGEPLTNQWDETPPCSAPPVFTPPEVPEHLMPFSEPIVIDASPTVEEEPEESKEQTPQISQASIVNGAIETAITGDNTGGSSNGFSISLSKGQQKQYGAQFQEDKNIPTIGIEVEDQENGTAESTTETECKKKKAAADFNLSVAQIVITAATPMTEEADTSFPLVEENPKEDDEDESELAHKQPSKEPRDPIEEHFTNHVIVEEPDEELIEIQEEQQQSVKIEDATEEKPYESGPLAISSSTSDGDTTGPSTAENSVSHASYADVEGVVDVPKQVVGGRASIPDELEPHQLARLQDLKESNA